MLRVLGESPEGLQAERCGIRVNEAAALGTGWAHVAGSETYPVTFAGFGQRSAKNPFCWMSSERCGGWERKRREGKGRPEMRDGGVLEREVALVGSPPCRKDLLTFRSSLRLSLGFLPTHRTSPKTPGTPGSSHSAGQAQHRSQKWVFRTSYVGPPAHAAASDTRIPHLVA
jgi:hypothetical protein